MQTKNIHVAAIVAILAIRAYTAILLVVLTIFIWLSKLIFFLNQPISTLLPPPPSPQ